MDSISIAEFIVLICELKARMALSFKYCSEGQYLSAYSEFLRAKQISDHLKLSENVERMFSAVQAWFTEQKSNHCLSLESLINVAKGLSSLLQNEIERYSAAR